MGDEFDELYGGAVHIATMGEVKLKAFLIAQLELRFVWCPRATHVM